ncbi:hypothetical protein [Aurantiacibacter flavus]|uniref:Lipoprotein n=1 Tax=Aurantiacibacter flavus TaxID=3145232 RepID=A0ABV0CU02_9SPHN
MMLTSLLFRRRARHVFGSRLRRDSFFASGPCNTCHTLGLAGLAALTLAGCGSASGDELAEGAVMVECAVVGAASFAPDCSMELREDSDGRTAILRHPDGGFRRFQLGVPGEGLITADGMEQAEVVPGEGIVEVRVGADRYRLPMKP